ncbi:MAG: hypothetical protein PHH11_10385, partial [Methylomonas sp.]|nr:hypothetical protein [Methylomonas sp.]
RRVGWKMALFGPIFTIVGARNATQSQRNADDVRDLIEQYRGMVEITDYKITFPKIKFFQMPVPETAKAVYEKFTGNKPDDASSDSYWHEKAETQYQPPLSWTLTKKQRQDIRSAWRQVLNTEGSDAARLIARWKALHPS